MPKTIRIYSTPNCQGCRNTYRWLDKRGIPYVVEDAVELNNYRAIKALGYSSAPVVIVGDQYEEQHWSGFRPDLLAKHCEPSSPAEPFDQEG